MSWWFYLMQPAVPAALARNLSPLMRLLENKYYLDWFNEHVLAKGCADAGHGLCGKAAMSASSTASSMARRSGVGRPFRGGAALANRALCINTRW